MNFRTHRLFKKVIGIFFLVLIFEMLGCANVKENKSTKIDSLISAYNDYGHFHGTVLLAENGNIILEKGYGFANREWDMPHDPDTKFRIASITKTFTAVLIMQLVETGKIDLNGKLTNYLPSYRKDTGERVTIHHLLSHSSGIPDYLRIPGFWQNQLLLQYSRKDFAHKFCSGDLEFEPGSKYQYNNSGYYLLGLIIEELTGESFETALQENILKPLGMKNSGVDNNRAVLKKRASGYVKSGFDFLNVPYLNIDNSYTSGQMYSTAEDLYLFDQALYTDQLLSTQYRDKLFTPYYFYAKGDYSIGYDWELGKLPLTSSEGSVTYAQHMGGLNGFNTLFCRLIEDKHLIVLLGNLDSAPLKEMRQKIINILYDIPYDMPLKSIAWEIRDIIEEKGMISAIQAYHSIRAEQSDEYDLGERELNVVGYYLLRNGKIKEAIEIFKLNVEVYPDYANGWDSLAEAYMLNGDKKLAIKYYQKCLELNPSSQNARNMLKRLTE
ncbi:MAG: serine hydrolase [Candidatus Aminicenantales bacterium]